MDDHERGCEGRTYTCTCGYDDTIATRIEALEADNARFRDALDRAAARLGFCSFEMPSREKTCVIVKWSEDARAALKGDE